MKSRKKTLRNSIKLPLMLLCAAWLVAPGVRAQNSSDETKKIQEQVRRQMQQSQEQQSTATTTVNAPGLSATAPPQEAAKKQGVLRIGVVLPKVEMAQGVDAAEPLRNTLVTYMSGPAIEIVPITSRIPLQIEAEIKQKECDYILVISVTQKKGGGGFGGFMKKVAPIAAMASPIGMIGMGGGLGGVVAATAVGTGADLAGTMAGSIKAKDEITFEYSLTAPGSQTPRIANTTKVKAKKDGEDVLTPLVERAATDIVNDLAKK